MKSKVVNPDKFIWKRFDSLYEKIEVVLENLYLVNSSDAKKHVQNINQGMGEIVELFEKHHPTQVSLLMEKVSHLYKKYDVQFRKYGVKRKRMRGRKISESGIGQKFRKFTNFVLLSSYECASCFQNCCSHMLSCSHAICSDCKAYWTEYYIGDVGLRCPDCNKATKSKENDEVVGTLLHSPTPITRQQRRMSIYEKTKEAIEKIRKKYEEKVEKRITSCRTRRIFESI